jgi:hypothetical protein
MFRIFVQISNFDPLVRRHENSRQFILYCMTQMDKSGLLLYTTRLESLIIGLFVVCYMTHLNESYMTY